LVYIELLEVPYTWDGWASCHSYVVTTKANQNLILVMLVWYKKILRYRLNYEIWSDFKGVFDQSCSDWTMNALIKISRDQNLNT